MGFAIKPKGKAEDEGEVARASGPGNPGDIQSHRQHPEEGGKDILALGYPGDRFYVERVKGKESRHKGAPPECSGHPVEDEKEQERIGKVEQEVGEMVPCRLQPEELDIYHVGDPGQGMPVAGMAGGACPKDPLHGKAVLDVPVAGDVLRIIVINEIAARDLPEGHGGGDDEEQGDYEQVLLCRLCGITMAIGAQIDAGFFYRRYLSCRCFLSVVFSGRVCCSLSFVLHGSPRPAFPRVEALSLDFTFLTFFQYTSTCFPCQTGCCGISCGPETILVSVTITARTLRLALKSLRCAFQSLCYKSSVVRQVRKRLPSFSKESVAAPSATKSKREVAMKKTYRLQEYVVKGKEVFVGLEDSKRTWKLAVRSEKMIIHQVSMEAKYPVLIGYLRNKFPECTIHLMYEAGFKGFNLYDALAEDGIDCVVIPLHVVTEPKVNRIKTDKRDARRLALVLENHDFKDGCYVPDKERREDRQVSRTLIAVQKDIIRTRNRIRKLLRFHGIEVPFPDRWGRGEFRALKKLELSEPLRISLDIFLTQLEELWAHQVSLRAALRKLCKKDATQGLYDRPQSPGDRLVHRHQVRPRTGGGSLPVHEWKKDCQFRGAHVQRRLHGRDHTQGAHHRHGSRVHKGNPHRELVDGGPQGSGPPCEVHASMACERQQEESDRRGGTDADRTVSDLPHVWHALRDRCRCVVCMERYHVIFRWLRDRS